MKQVAKSDNLCRILVLLLSLLSYEIGSGEVAPWNNAPSILNYLITLCWNTFETEINIHNIQCIKQHKPASFRHLDDELLVLVTL